MKKRIIAYNTTLGVDQDGKMNVFKVKEGEVIEVGEPDKYHRVHAIIQGKEMYMYWSAIKRISNGR